MKHYSLEAVDKLIDYYTEHNGNMYTIQEGALGYGITVLKAPKLKTAVIKERYLNEWSSTHTVTLYNKTPLKYEEV